MKPDYIHLETGETTNEWDLEARYEEDLNDAYGEVEVCGYTYSAGTVLKTIDPIAFRCGFVDWMNAAGWEDYSDELADELAKKIAA